MCRANEVKPNKSNLKKTLGEIKHNKYLEAFAHLLTACCLSFFGDRFQTLWSYGRVWTRVAELHGLLTGGVTPTRCKSLNQAVQMAHCKMCLPANFIYFFPFPIL